MNIQPIQYNSVSMQGKKDGSWNRIKRRIAQKVLDTLPSQGRVWLSQGSSVALAKIRKKKL